MSVKQCKYVFYMAMQSEILNHSTPEINILVYSKDSPRLFTNNRQNGFSINPEKLFKTQILMEIIS